MTQETAEVLYERYCRDMNIASESTLKHALRVPDLQRLELIGRLQTNESILAASFGLQHLPNITHLQLGKVIPFLRAVVLTSDAPLFTH